MTSTDWLGQQYCTYLTSIVVLCHITFIVIRSAACHTNNADLILSSQKIIKCIDVTPAEIYCQAT